MKGLAETAAAAAVVALLGACSGPAGTPAPARANQAPSVSAGPTQTVAAASRVILIGAASDRDGAIVAHRWQQLSGPPVTLDRADAATARFTAPDANAVLTFRFAATDDAGATARDSVTIIVEERPPPPNEPPAVNAGADQTVASRASVALDGAAADGDGTIASVAWTQLGGPPVTLSSTTTEDPTFTAPAGPANLVFQLRATDDAGASGTDTVTISVEGEGPGNLPPSVNAGPDASALAGTVVTLAGSASDADGSIASLSWAQADGPVVTLSSSTTASPTFTAPEAPAALRFTLTATDDAGASAGDSVTITVVDELAQGCLVDLAPPVERADLVSGTPSRVATPLLRFVQTSDEHIMDEDGAAVNGGSFLDPLHPVFDAAVRFQDEYSDEVMNRMIATINACHAQAPVELVVATGDNTDLGTVAEVRRLIDNLDGTFDRIGDFEKKCRAALPGAPEPVLAYQCTRFTGRGVPDTQTPDPDPSQPGYQFLPTRTALQMQSTELAAASGRDADGNADPARQTVTQSPGLPQVLRCNAGDAGCANERLAVPYYIAFGNHDGAIRGTLATLGGLQEASATFGRHYLRRQHEFIDEFFETGALPGPLGHGFDAVDATRWNDADERNDGYYAFDAGTGGAVRMIVLNTLIDGTDPRLPAPVRDPLRNPFGLADGMVDAAQFGWLVAQLDQALADGQLVLVFSHHADLTFSEYGMFADGAPLGVPAATVDGTLASYPNVVAWIAGHTHRHRIRAFKVTGASGSNGFITAPVACKTAGACAGFWQIETASLIDFPQEARTLELLDNGDGTGTIRSVVLRHDFARSQALATQDDLCQFYLSDPAAVEQALSDADLSTLCKQGGTRDGAATDRNVDLLFRMP